jgi:hypothetical protein
MSGLLSAFDPPPPLMLPQTGRTKSRRASTPSGSQLTLTSVQRALRYAQSCIWHMAVELLFLNLIRYARAWLWHMVVGFLFSDRSRNIMSWLVLLILRLEWDVIATYSWGSAALSWLYRALCDGCTRTGENANLGGCAYLLQVWMWDHFPSVDHTGVCLRYSLTFLFSLCMFCTKCVLLTIRNFIYRKGHLRTSNPSPQWATAGATSQTLQAP